jgi:hypothetical protein
VPAVRRALRLCLLVLAQTVDELGWERERPSAASGLGLLEDKALPGDPVQAPIDRESPAVEVDVGPRQPTLVPSRFGVPTSA